MRWMEAKDAFEKQYWVDLIAQTASDMRSMVRISGQSRTAIHKILNRNGLRRSIPAKDGVSMRMGNWAQHGL